ncbi:MAG: type II toxin-antitoxin system YoeB family toxin [Bacteroidaceae bacterium]|nr:type II toxin-antitoxin system YoeB family toxin [Bacteroidaceae bacterium]
MNYSIEFKEQAARDLLALAKNEPKAFAKAQLLINELRDHPRTGTGKPEPLQII